MSLPQTYVAREHLLRYLRALPTIRVHPELDGCTLDIVHSLKGVTMSIQWIAIYPVDSAIHRLNNWGLNFTQEYPSLSSFLRTILIFVKRYDVMRSSCCTEQTGSHCFPNGYPTSLTENKVVNRYINC